MYRPLTNELQKVANNELNEVNSQIQFNLDHIKQWIEAQPHLNVKIGEQLILSFLRCCKFSLECTKEKIDNYYTVRTLAADLFTNRDPFSPELQAILKSGCVLPLPKPDPKSGCRILLCRFSDNLNPQTMSISNVLKIGYMVLDILLREDDNAVVSGIISWSYFKNFSSKYAMQITPSNLQTYSTIDEKGYPFRFKGLYYSHLPKIFEFVYDCSKVFYSEKIKERMGIYSKDNFHKLYDKIPQEMLPKDFGGSNGSIEEIIYEWKEKVESYKDWFLNDEQDRTIESLRPGMPKTFSDTFGVEGSFRKLIID